MVELLAQSMQESNGEEDVRDPLDDEMYALTHRRFERRERQMRNIEREHAQHEKLQLDRILDELRGPDWLRVMGIGGIIPDQDKKLYEPKRSFFVKELTALLDKFKAWKEEEKRRKLEKERMLLREEEAKVEKEEEEEEEEKEEEEEEDAVSDDLESINTSDVDAWAARQLQQEARRACSGKRQQRPRSKDARLETKPPAVVAMMGIPEEKPFTSFFANRSLRDAAFSRSSSESLAFGVPVPEAMAEHEFELPHDILTPEAIQSCRRKRRRMKRDQTKDS